MSRVAQALIKLDALKHNLSVARQAAPESNILAVIKANAYGHGLLAVAHALSSADAFAVAHFEEAVTLREKFPKKTIVLLQGFADEIELTLLLSQFIQPVIHSPEQINWLEKFAAQNRDETFSVWLKVDTGMHRLGVSVNDFEQCWIRLNAIEGLKGRVKLMSHFANADVINHPTNVDQSRLFFDLGESLTAEKGEKVEKSLVNSAGLLSRADDFYQWVRPGIMLYGVSPFENGSALEFDLQPVMNLSSRIIAINTLSKGQTVGYGSCWRAPASTCIAVVGIGYGDGYPRHIAENTPVLIEGKRYPIVGRVSMDMITVNLGIDGTVNVGDKVLLWGEGLPVEEISLKASTIAYELLCQVTARVKFVYQGDDVLDSAHTKASTNTSVSTGN